MESIKQVFTLIASNITHPVYIQWIEFLKLQIQSILFFEVLTKIRQPTLATIKIYLQVHGVEV